MNALAFELPTRARGHAPPEARGVARDAVRLLVATRSDGELEHRRFLDLPAAARPGRSARGQRLGDAAGRVGASTEDGSRVRVHFATRAPRLDESWRVVEIRSADGSRPRGGHAGGRLDLDGGARCELVAPYASGARLMLARFDGLGSVERYLERHGEPIRYGYVTRSWPLSAYQNVYATTPGSAEMPSAGRPFTAELITRLVARGVLIAPITLHTGVSSPERHEAAVPRAVLRPRADRPARRGDESLGRAGDRRGHHGRPRARDRALGGESDGRLDRTRDHPRPRPDARSTA